MARSRRTPLTAKEIDQALQQLAELSVSDDPGRLTRIQHVARALVERGEDRGAAAWASDPAIGPERAALLSTLAATTEDRQELEKVALLAHRSIRLNANPDAAGIALATFYSSPDGFDLVHCVGARNRAPLTEGVRILLEAKYGISVEDLAGISISVRTERLLELFGYALSGLLRQDVESGTLGADATGLQVLRRGMEQAWEVAMINTQKGNGRGAQVYAIEATQGVVREGSRPSNRPDTAFVNTATGEIFLGLGFSGHTTDMQKSGIDRFLRPLRDALDKGLIKEWSDFRVLPFYMHAGIFVPHPPITTTGERTACATRPGEKTAQALSDCGVPMEAQAALATLDLVGVALQSQSPESLLSFFECNPLVCGTSTLDHLRHVERTASLAPERALDAHVGFLCQQSELAIEAACAIALCSDVQDNVEAAFNTLSDFVKYAPQSMGQMSRSQYERVFQPCLARMADRLEGLVKENEEAGFVKPSSIQNGWARLAADMENLADSTYEMFQKRQAKVLRTGDRGLLAEAAEIYPNRGLDAVPLSPEKSIRGPGSRRSR